MLESVWFVGIGGEQHGPMPYLQVTRWINEGRVKGADYVFSKGMADWAKLETIPAFSAYFGAAAPRTAVPGPPPQAATRPSADVIDYITKGEGPQTLEVTLDPAEGCMAMEGSLFFMDPYVAVLGGDDQGAAGALARAGVVGGTELFENGHAHARQRVSLSPRRSGRVLALDVGGEDIGVMVRADALFAWARGLEVEYLGEPLPGLPNMVSLSGKGWAFVQTEGVLMERLLGVEQQVKVAPRGMLGWAGGARCELAGAGSSSVIVVTGAGKVWAQSLG